MNTKSGELNPAIRDTRTAVRGRWLWIARSIWVVVAVAGIALYIAAVPGRFRVSNPDCQTQVCNPDDQQQANSIRDIGLPGALVAWYFSAVDSIVALVYIVTGALIFWRKSDSKVALVVSLMLVATGLVFAPGIAFLVAATPILAPALIVLQVVGYGFMIIVLFFFPDGRFVPRWTLWLAPVFLAGQALWMSLEISVDTYSDPAYLGYMLSGAAVGLGAQIYRYRRVSTPAQRQQTKWVLLGLSAMFAFYLIGFFPGFFNRTLISTDLPYRIVRVTFFGALPSLLLPIALLFAMQRNRLWDVDFIINRALVYGAVTLLLGGFFVGGFFGLRTLLGALLGSGQDLIAVAVPAVAITALFNPTRNLAQRYIDRRFYGIKLDYVKAAKAYSGSQKEPAHVTGYTMTSFGSYTGLHLIGRGGMGEVYQAQHPKLKRSVAIKILSKNTDNREAAEKRFRREAQTIAGLKHPNIITLHDVGEQAGQPFMVMEFIDGTDLSDLIRQRGHLTLDEAMPILTDVAAALDYAHLNGVIHRDIKPSNVMIEQVTATGSGKSQHAVLMDFGIAKSYAAGTKLTQTGMMGTLDYISPEQIRGASEVDARADIYSFGVMAYQLLTGKVPFEHNNPGAMVLAHLMEPAPDACAHASGLPALVCAAIQRAMSKKPDDRFATAGEFVAAFA